ncbi:hypothetical protein BY996DRAFT_1434397 [Phakopsora pachyrhizi]|nr:hypothetical protein BY996DRAFT_1434397 [Phakopsora pachyrhizi]
MKRPSALVVLLGILGVVTSVSGSVPHKILKRNEEKFRGNITGRCLEPPVDLTSAGYFTKSCYKSDQRTALIEDCLQLKENIKNNQELIECGPGCNKFVPYKSCAVFLMVTESAKKNYQITTSSLVDTISGTMRNCQENQESFAGGWYSFYTPENVEWDKQNPSSSDYPPIITAVAAAPN